jgi:hypothetical protein
MKQYPKKKEKFDEFLNKKMEKNWCHLLANFHPKEKKIWWR